jgi:hypothetical protein
MRSGQRAVARFQDIVIQDGSSFALKQALRGTCQRQGDSAHARLRKKADDEDRRAARAARRL